MVACTGLRCSNILKRSSFGKVSSLGVAFKDVSYCSGVDSYIGSYLRWLASETHLATLVETS